MGNSYHSCFYNTLSLWVNIFFNNFAIVLLKILKRLILFSLFFLVGCVSSPEYRIDSVSDEELAIAKEEIQSTSVKKSRAFGWRKVNRLKKVINRLDAPSKKICYASYRGNDKNEFNRFKSKIK